MKVGAKLKDYPSISTLMVSALVATHFALYERVAWLPDVASKMATSSEASTVYLGFAGVLAVLAGFAGVTLVFAMTPGNARMARLRVQGGERLEANWISPIRGSLFASLASAACAIVKVAGAGEFAWWLFEFISLVAVVAAIRMAWLLATLVRIVRVEDEDAAAGRHQAPVTVAELTRKNSRSA